MGEMLVPEDALWGAQTQRAVVNFPISGIRFGRRFIHALGSVKRACALANYELGLLTPEVTRAVVVACDEVILGTLDAHFPLDIFQTGSGTSTNMNANEVIAARGMQVLAEGATQPDPSQEFRTPGPPSHRAGSRSIGAEGSVILIHPNDHVNMSQSSNDVIPTATPRGAHDGA